MRINKASIVIDGDEYQCLANSTTLEPGDPYTYCYNEWTFSTDLVITYDATSGSWNQLNALRDTVVTVVVKPADATVAATNPSATFDARIPAIPFMNGAEKGERMVFTLELMTEDEPVFAVA